jgi:hypothetical protein
MPYYDAFFYLVPASLVRREDASHVVIRIKKTTPDGAYKKGEELVVRNRDFVEKVRLRKHDYLARVRTVYVP